MNTSTSSANVSGLVAAHRAARPDETAIVDGDRVVTWVELDAAIERVGRGLGSLGVVAGQRVVIAMANGLEFIESYLAVLRAGLVAVPINAVATAPEIAGVVRDSGAQVVMCDATMAGAVREALGGWARGDSAGEVQQPVVVVSGQEPGRGEVAYDELGDGAVLVSPPDPEALAVLLYTSGTSSSPRAAMLSHRALLANVRQCAATEPAPISADDRVLGVVPFSHVYGLNGILGQSLLQGSTLVVGRRFDPDETLDLIETERVTVVPVAPPVIVAWHARGDIADRLRGVRLLLSGAAPLSLDVVTSFEERTGIAVQQGYGLTECAPVVTSTIASDGHKRGSSGQPLPGIELEVVDASGRPTQPDDPGEVRVRGDNTFSGYWPDGDGGPDAEGWVSTGDIGYVDADGDLFLVDRLKELVIVSGFNVYPSEIEDVISRVTGVREAAVIGIADDRTGEAVRAFVVPADANALSGSAADDLITRVRVECETHLARFKRPRDIEVVERLPHSATGKVAKGRLRANESRRRLGLS